MKRRTIILFFIFLLIVASFYWIHSSSKKETSTVSISPVPFAELTIPYLRNKEFKSKLGELAQVGGGLNYTSYLTNYMSDGLRINGLLTVPNGDPPPGGWPAIVFIHGYIPPALYQTQGPQYSDYVDYLARNGFVVFKIDLRGHGSSEGEPGGGYFGADYVTDALNARAALQVSDFVNPKKIGMWGHSMAGNVIMRSFAVKPEIPAVVIWAGAVYSYADMQKYGIQDGSYRPPQSVTMRVNRRQALMEKVGSASAQSAFWQQMAPVYFLNDLKGAIQIHHAVDDTVVNIGYSRDLMKLLNKTKVPHELVEYPSGGHNITGQSFVEAMDKTVVFFKKYLE